MSEVHRKDIYVSDPTFSELEKGIHNSYPNACVLWMEEIRNPMLEAEYQKQKEEIEAKRGKPCEEKMLYHGTNESVANIIIHNGFDPTKNRRALYGRGSYFAKNASYSRDYSPPATDEVSFMLICSVLVGNVSVYGVNQLIDTTRFDNSVDHIRNPTIYVTPYTFGAVPRYMIAFYRNAK